jgi:hypothetical protein
MFRRAAIAALTALTLGAAPALAQAEDNGTDPSPAPESCQMTDGDTLESGETHYEFQSGGKVLELECQDGTLCGTMLGANGLVLSYACESWGETVQHRNDARGARQLGVLVTQADGVYRIRAVGARLKTVAKKALPIAG